MRTRSLLATRLRLDDMLPMAEKLDQAGFWSLETWGGATFDACIRYLGEDPWERLRELKKAMPNTRQHKCSCVVRIYWAIVTMRMMSCAVLLSGLAHNGVDVFRIFDAMNDVRNLKTAIEATIANDGHAQGTLAYNG